MERRKRGILKGFIVAMLVLLCIPMNVKADEIEESIVYFEDGISPDLTVETEELSEGIQLFSTTKSINWSVSKKTLKKTGSFYLKKGNKVSIRFDLSYTSNVKIGIIHAKTKKNYVKASPTVRGTISAPESGNYCVFVENNSGKTTNVSGTYTR